MPVQLKQGPRRDSQEVAAAERHRALEHRERKLGRLRFHRPARAEEERGRARGGHHPHPTLARHGSDVGFLPAGRVVPEQAQPAVEKVDAALVLLERPPGSSGPRGDGADRSAERARREKRGPVFDGVEAELPLHVPHQNAPAAPRDAGRAVQAHREHRTAAVVEAADTARGDDEEFPARARGHVEGELDGRARPDEAPRGVDAEHGVSAARRSLLRADHPRAAAGPRRDPHGERRGRRRRLVEFLRQTDDPPAVAVGDPEPHRPRFPGRLQRRVQPADRERQPEARGQSDEGSRVHGRETGAGPKRLPLVRLLPQDRPAVR